MRVIRKGKMKRDANILHGENLNLEFFKHQFVIVVRMTLQQPNNAMATQCGCDLQMHFLKEQIQVDNQRRCLFLVSQFSRGACRHIHFSEEAVLSARITLNALTDSTCDEKLNITRHL